MLELLSPAGSMEALHAAVQNGANAVYLGCGAFNARQSAKNFTLQSLEEAIKYCHVRGVKVHLTLNTLVSDKELPQAMDLIRQAAQLGVDAFIVQDLGLVRIIRQMAPTVPIHGSTQMSIHTLDGVKLCAMWGLRRVVLSRELSREEIAAICRQSPIEIEVFAHGALCMCYSGQCYMSGLIGGRSGNRGRCAQPCRQSYGFGRYEEKYPLSLKDNCLVRELKDLEKMGVASIKLEGRMKRAEYVATVTNVYRTALNTGEVTGEMLRALYTAFNRQGFTDGYYQDSIGPKMFGIREDTRDNPKWLQEAKLSYESRENGLVSVEFFALIDQNGSQLAVRDRDGHLCKVGGPLPEPARTRPLTQTELQERLEKTGGTPYVCTGVQASIAPGLTLSAAAVNAMRRSVLDQLTALRSRKEPVQLHKPQRPSNVSGGRKEPVLTVEVYSREQITPALLSMRPARLYVPLHLIAKDPVFFRDLGKRVKIAAVLPRIVREKEMPQLRANLAAARSALVREALVGNLSHLIAVREAGLDIRGDFGLNLYNSYSADALKDLELLSATVSFEMTMPQIRDLTKSVPAEVIVYGRLPLMVTENCIIRNRTGQCTCQLGQSKLTDKTGAEFPILKDGDSCRSVLLNGKKLYWLDRPEDLRRLGAWAVRLRFTTESPREVDSILQSYLDSTPFDPGFATRGLYLRGVE